VVDVIQCRLILLLIVMGTISGCRSYYALEDFGARHYGAVSEQLGLEVTRLPSDTTFRRILQKLDFQTLAQQFGQWVNSAFNIGGCCKSVDRVLDWYPKFITINKQSNY